MYYQNFYAEYQKKKCISSETAAKMKTNHFYE